MRTLAERCFGCLRSERRRALALLVGGRATNAKEYLFAVFELVNEARIEFSLVRVGNRRLQRGRQHVDQTIAGEIIVLVDVRDAQAVSREYNLGVVVKVEL